MSKQNEILQTEPSMDEILASIKSIISDDVKQAASSSFLPPQAINKNNDADVLDLTEMIKEDGSVVSLQKGGNMSKEAKKLDQAKVNHKEEENIFIEDTQVPEKEIDFISSEALTESMRALQGLDSISNDTLQEVKQAFTGGKTLEALMSDILRPMLKEWIDANLPSLVKVIVNDQVEKVIQARRTMPHQK
jgi:cell pole-organizing protein PopZ